jgi:RNA polymerase sigma-70 factor, ECF subfamily
MRLMSAESLVGIPRTQAAALERAVQGDAEAFAELLRQHQRMVYSIAWHFFHDAVLADDLAQDVFLHLYQNLRGIHSESHLVSWVRQVTIRKCIDHARWLRRSSELNVEAITLLSSDPEQADCLGVEHLQRLVAALPPKLRAVVTLRYQEDMQPREIADLLRCPVNSVKSRLRRALALLRQRMRA